LRPCFFKKSRSPRKKLRFFAFFLSAPPRKVRSRF
jgi:hypothetical protein